MNDEATARSQQLWDSIAGGWVKERDAINQMEYPVTERMLEALAVHPGDTILELCAGPGEVGLTLARRHPDVNVVVTDFAPRMIQAASNAAKERGLTNVECRVVDAQDVDLPDASVDGVLCRCGLMLVPDIGKALSEVRRVLRPGRSLAYTTWTPPDTNPWMAIFGAALMRCGHIQPSDGGELVRLGDEASNRVAASAAGFPNVRCELVDLTFRYPSFQRYWQISAEIAGPLVHIVNSLSEDEREAVRSQVEEYATPFKTDSGLAFPSRRIFVRAW
jgi:ubiquinone/menaquinone biosynthesis C-methylase UbiE